MRDAVATRYSLDPFGEEVKRICSSPYQRGLVLTALKDYNKEKINVEYVKVLMDTIQKMTDAGTTSIVNALYQTHIKKPKLIKSIFRKKESQILVVPRRDGTTRRVLID